MTDKHQPFKMPEPQGHDEMTDKMLLEAAARAAGYDCAWSDSRQGFYFGLGTYTPQVWNPLGNDGDAFDLMVRTPLLAGFDLQYALAIAWQACNTHDERRAHVRRLIVETAARAAAALSGVKEG